MSLVAFLLECGAIAAVVGAAASLLSLLGATALRDLGQRLRSDLRADLTAILALAPAAIVLAVLTAVTLPSLSALLLGMQDHCTDHSHPHLCLVHAGPARPLLAALGAAALAFALFRLLAAARSAWRVHARFAALARLGNWESGKFPLVRVPGRPRLCHAVGTFNRRVFVSHSFAPHLTAAEFDSALAHEHAHLERHDPLMTLLLDLASAAVPPFISPGLIAHWRRASEEACDAHAATLVDGGPTVASALVKMTALQGLEAPADASPAFGETALEQRVQRLLEGPDAIRRPRPWAPALVAFVCVGLLAIAARFAPALHHAVETALHLLS